MSYCDHLLIFYYLSFSQINFCNDMGRFDLEITTFQMAVLFAWNQRPREKLSYESLRLATELPDAELRRTLLVGHPMLMQCMVVSVYAWCLDPFDLFFFLKKICLFIKWHLHVSFVMYTHIAVYDSASFILLK